MVPQRLLIRPFISITDEALIARWQQGDERSFDVLYNRHVLNLLELLTRKTGCAHTARELVQDVFLAIHIQKEKLAGIIHFKSYLLTIAKHKVFNYYRRKLLEQKYQQQIFLRVPELAVQSDKILENKELLLIVSEKIEQLPPKCREIFRLSREEHLSYKKIAQTMSISENTVDQHIRKALRIIRATLNDYHISPVFIFLFLGY